MKPDLESIGDLKFRDSIKVNGLLLYRAEEGVDLNLPDYWQESNLDYVEGNLNCLFYTEWDKEKNLLPKPSHRLRIYVKYKKTIKEGKESYDVVQYIKGTIKNLITNSEQEITSIEK